MFFLNGTMTAVFFQTSHWPLILFRLRPGPPRPQHTPLKPWRRNRLQWRTTGHSFGRSRRQRKGSRARHLLQCVWVASACHRSQGNVWWEMAMDQYLYIPFFGGWTSINPSYFEVNYRGTRFWPTARSFGWFDGSRWDGEAKQRHMEFTMEFTLSVNDWRECLKQFG